MLSSSSNKPSGASRPDPQQAGGEKLKDGQGGAGEAPIEENNEFLSIIGSNDLKKISNSKESPWRRICSLVIRANGGTGHGTGWLAGPRTVITAGHCVHDDPMGGWATSIEVMSGRNEFGAKRTVTSDSFSSVTKWIQDRVAGYDIGAIHLDEPLGDEMGWFGFTSASDDFLSGETVTVAGYPASEDGMVMMSASGKVLTTDSRRLYYTADTLEGTSGAPVFVQASGEQPVVVGIHAYGETATPSGFDIEANSAPRIDDEIYDRLADWIDNGP